MRERACLTRWTRRGVHEKLEEAAAQRVGEPGLGRATFVRPSSRFRLRARASAQPLRGERRQRAPSLQFVQRQLLEETRDSRRRQVRWRCLCKTRTE